MYHGMKVIKGKVVSGKVVVEGTLPEGATVTVLAPEAEEFTLMPDEVSALLAAITEADRGEVVDAESVLREVGGVWGGRRGGVRDPSTPRFPPVLCPCYTNLAGAPPWMLAVSRS